MRAIVLVAWGCLLAAACGADEQVRGIPLPAAGTAGGTGGSTGAAGGTLAGAGSGTAGGATSSGGSGGTSGIGGLGGAAAGGTGGVQGGECEQHVIDGTLATPDVLIVLDRSGSMNPDNNDDLTDRWGGSRMALIEVTATFDAQIRFGLMTFPGAQGGRGDECATGELDVPIDVNTGAVIASTLQSMDADGRTPTAPSLQEALRILNVASGPDEVAGAKYVLLVTDGDPNCGGGGRDRDDAARQQTIAAIEALTAAGIKTFVVGYQTAGTDFADQLDRMAAAGGTGENVHHSVASGADLTATMTEIAGRLVSCSYRLDAPVYDPTHVLVTVGGRQRNFNQLDDGWTLGTDNRTVTLSGAACDDVRGGALFVVTVTCAPVVPI